MIVVVVFLTIIELCKLNKEKDGSFSNVFERVQRPFGLKHTICLLRTWWGGSLLKMPSDACHTEKT